MRKKRLVSALLICMLALTGCGGNKNTGSERDSVIDNIDEKVKEKISFEPVKSVEEGWEIALEKEEKSKNKTVKPVEVAKSSRTSITQ